MWMNYEHDFVIKVYSYSHKANVHSDNWLQPGQHLETRSARGQSTVLCPESLQKHFDMHILRDNQQRNKVMVGGGGQRLLVLAFQLMLCKN